MLGWIENDADGRSVLMRSGTGRVSAVLPVGSPEQDAVQPFHTVVIDVESGPGRPRSIRLSTRARVNHGESLHREALEGLSDQDPRSWCIAWHRHSWVPDEVDITSLDLQSDTQAWLVSLERLSASTDKSADARPNGALGHE